LAGKIDIAERVICATARVTELLIPLAASLAVIREVPRATAVARPVFVIVATEVFSELHDT
jgi:hypothetical protein